MRSGAGPFAAGRAIVLREHGAAGVLKAEPIEVGAPGPGELAVCHTAIGVNFHDIYVRSGLYRTLPLPGIPGIEAVGRVTAVGAGVEGFVPGDRVGYISDAYGCYASQRLLDATLAVKLPEGLSDIAAASLLLKGLTVEMLVSGVCKVRAGDRVLVQAAAGGVGRLLVRWLAHLGAVVIGTAGSPQKAAIARAAGCTEVILYRQDDVAQRVAAITGGRGVDVVYDGVGRDTFAGSLASLSPCGHLVNFGQASGPVEPVLMPQLAARSTTLSRPVVFHYTARRERLEQMSASLFTAFAEGWLAPEQALEFPLEDAAQAHQLLESGQATRPIVLRP
jgi:NADPH2:quinone reductase